MFLHFKSQINFIFCPCYFLVPFDFFSPNNLCYQKNEAGVNKTGLSKRIFIKILKQVFLCVIVFLRIF